MQLSRYGGRTLKTGYCAHSRDKKIKREKTVSSSKKL